MPKREKIDELGNRYGMLTVVAPAPSRGNGARWLCRCDCGNEREISGNQLRMGVATSCGCVRNRREYFTHVECEKCGSHDKGNIVCLFMGE